MTRFKIRISGLNLHRVLAFFDAKKISVFDLSSSPHCLVLTLKKRDFLLFQASEIYPGFTVEILSEFGPRKVFGMIWRRAGLFIGVLAMLALTINLSSQVWQISICPEQHTCQNGSQCIFAPENQALLREELENLGIKKGARLSSLPSNREVERQIMQAFPQVAGLKLERVGTMLVLDIKEAQLPAHMVSEDLLSSVSGIVLSMDVSSGKALVKDGDIVLAGQTLVEREDGLPVSATITLRSFFHDTIIYSERQVEYRKTGEKTFRRRLKLFSLNIGGKQGCDYDLYRLSTSRSYAFYNFFLPIICETDLYEQLEMVETFVPFDDARPELEKDLREKVIATLPRGAELRNTTYATYREGERVRLDCYVEALVTMQK